MAVDGPKSFGPNSLCVSGSTLPLVPSDPVSGDTPVFCPQTGGKALPPDDGILPAVGWGDASKNIEHLAKTAV